MKLIMELMELALYDIVQIATVALELFGIAVLVFTAVKCFIRWLRNDHENIRLELKRLLEIITNKDAEGMKKYLTKIREKIK